MAEAQHEHKNVVLQGRVIMKVLAEGTVMQRQFVALEEKPGGQFLALHHVDGHRDWSDLMGHRIEAEGDIWFQSLTVRSIEDLGE